MVRRLKQLTVMEWFCMAACVILLMSFFVFPDNALAATTGQVQSKMNTATKAILAVINGLIVIAGTIAGSKIVIKASPNLDDPHEKNQMWRGLGSVLLAVGAGSAFVWLAPWIFSLFK